MRVSEIRVKQIRVNQGLGVLIFTDISIKKHSLYALSKPRSNLDTI